MESDQLKKHTTGNGGGSPTSSPEAAFCEDPPPTPNESVFASAVYRGLGEVNAPSTPGQPLVSVEDKVAAGQRLIEAQRKDIHRMSSRLKDIQNQLREKEGSVARLYTMIEKASPLLKQMSGWNAKLTEEQEQLQEELRKAKKVLGLDQAGTEDGAPVPAEQPSSVPAGEAQ